MGVYGYTWEHVGVYIDMSMKEHVLMGYIQVHMGTYSYMDYLGVHTDDMSIPEHGRS